MESAFETLCREIFQKNNLGIYITTDTIQKTRDFVKIYFSVNVHTNLSSIRSVCGVLSKHFADCLLACELIPKNALVLDIGCGGGFPTFPWAIMRPDISVLALDSTQKKIDFVKTTAKELELTNVQTICTRVEDPEFRSYKNKFDVVTARAVSNLRVLSELALPFVKRGGLFLSLKGSKLEDELTESGNTIAALGGVVEEVERVNLYSVPEDPKEFSAEWVLSDLISQDNRTKDFLKDFLNHSWISEDRTLLVVRKEKSSPPVYPRQYAQIIKHPIQ